MARILIVDDEEGIRRVLARHLVRRGHVVTSVADGKTAFEMIEAREFDAVVMDVCMPGVSAVEACAAGRESGAPVPPIILMTGHTEMIGAELGRGSGSTMSCYLTKPFTLEELDAVLGDVLECDALAPTPSRLREFPLGTVVHASN